MELPGYRYKSIPDKGTIRLFKLNRSRTDELCGSIVTRALSDMPPYYALSYHWGSGKHKRIINVDGAGIEISRVLYRALIAMRDHPWLEALDPPFEYVWIDQLCIKQDDHIERGHQVRQMRHIYSLSARTLIWLGPDEPSGGRQPDSFEYGHADKAFELLGRIEKLYLDENGDGRDFELHKQFESMTPEGHRRLGLPEHTHLSWQALRSVLFRPWFRRIWIIQETVLSPQDPLVLVGCHAVSWRTLARASLWLDAKNYSMILDGVGHVKAITKIVEVKTKRSCVDIIGLTMACRYQFRASDSRDKIYGLLALCKETSLEDDGHEVLTFTVSYDVNNKPQCVFRDLVRHSIRFSGTLDALSYRMDRSNIFRDHESSLNVKLHRVTSSWTPLMHLDDDQEFLTSDNRLLNMTYASPTDDSPIPPDAHASRDIKARIPSDPANDEVLSLAGVQIDHIRKVVRGESKLSWLKGERKVSFGWSLLAIRNDIQMLAQLMRQKDRKSADSFHAMSRLERYVESFCLSAAKHIVEFFMKTDCETAEKEPASGHYGNLSSSTVSSTTRRPC